MFQVLMESEQLPEINISLTRKKEEETNIPKHNQETQTTIKWMLHNNHHFYEKHQLTKLETPKRDFSGFCG